MDQNVTKAAGLYIRLLNASKTVNHDRNLLNLGFKKLFKHVFSDAVVDLGIARW